MHSEGHPVELKIRNLTVEIFIIDGAILRKIFIIQTFC